MNQKNHLIGLMLGDGHLEMQPNGKNACLRISRTSLDHSYLEFTAELLKKYNTPKSLTKIVINDKRTKKAYKSSRFRSKCDIFFTNFYNEWYYNKKKIVPKYLKLNPEIIATWFADDGCIRIDKSIYDVKLSTHSFSKKEVEYLSGELARFGVNSQIYSEKNKTQHTIRITRKSEVKNFVDLIRNPFEELRMQRKAIWHDKYSMLIPRELIECKWCYSDNTYKNGTNSGKQKYLCKDCGRQFTYQINL